MSPITRPRGSEGFPAEWKEILDRIDRIDPIRYGTTRNHGDGAVSVLSPYISRGVVSTRFVAERLRAVGYRTEDLTPFIQQMAWREYFQRVWQERGDDLNHDLKHSSDHVVSSSMPRRLMEGHTGIHSLDEMVNQLVTTGYMHNHYRLYLASVACNVGQTAWYQPARWMYYHLLDADWASNACSWQWVAGTFSSKRYCANQDNINRFSSTSQRGTFLDLTYEDLMVADVPELLRERCSPALTTLLPEATSPEVRTERPTFIYTFYNLDPQWHSGEEGNRILLLEPSYFNRYPVCERTMQFVLALSAMIPGIQVVVAEWDEFIRDARPGKVLYREHPANRHFRGDEEPREWLFPEVSGYYPSFFAYWKRCERLLRHHL
ncbi:MAG: FAD-binding domain-containing protein [Flavobacteriales bacterium]